MLEKRFQAYRNFKSVTVKDVPPMTDCILSLLEVFDDVTFTELTEVLRPYYGVSKIRLEVWRLIDIGEIDFTLEHGLQRRKDNGVYE